MIAELFLIMELLQTQKNQTSDSGRVVKPFARPFGKSTPTVAVPKPLYKPPDTFGGEIGPGGRPSF